MNCSEESTVASGPDPCESMSDCDHLLQVQRVIGRVLELSLEPLRLEAQLQQILELVIALPWLAVQRKGAIFVYDEPQRELVLTAQAGLACQLLDSCAQVPLGQCLCGRAMESCEVVFKPHLDAAHDTRFEGIPDHGHYCLPILYKGRRRGVLNVYVEAGHARNPLEQEFLAMVANILGGVIERAAAERELRYLKQALDQHAGVSIVDVRGRIVYANPRLCERMGYGQEELLGRGQALLRPDAPSEAGHQQLEHAIGSGQLWRGEICDRARDGSLLWSEMSAVPMLDSVGRPYQYVLIRNDITARKLAEQELSQKGAFLQNIAYSMGDGVIADDAQGSITFVNTAALSLLGWEEHELLGRNMWAAICGCGAASVCGDTAPAIVAALQDFHSYRDDDSIFRRQDGTPLPVSFVAAPMMDDRGYAGSITVFRDISGRKQAEREQQALIDKLKETQNQLLQSEKMASIGQLAAGVAHEINNPIGYVNSNLRALRQYVTDLFQMLDAYQTLEQSVAGSDPHRQAVQALRERLDLGFIREDTGNLLNESDEGVRRVKQIVNDLKDFSRMDSTEWHWADLESGLDSTLNIVHNEIKYKAEVVKEYGRIPQVECIGSQLNQVFMNILVNGAQAIEERGQITIRTGQEGGNRVWVEISDTGRGIKPEVLPRIFDPFFTTKPVGKGTGLGLSLSYSIVERHGGRIEVRSELGKGTCFRITLPLCRQPETAVGAGI